MTQNVVNYHDVIEVSDICMLSLLVKKNTDSAVHDICPLSIPTDSNNFMIFCERI